MACVACDGVGCPWGPSGGFVRHPKKARRGKQHYLSPTSNARPVPRQQSHGRANQTEHGADGHGNALSARVRRRVRHEAEVHGERVDEGERDAEEAADERDDLVEAPDLGDGDGDEHRDDFVGPRCGAPSSLTCAAAAA